MDVEGIARRIDHTILRPDAGPADLEALARETVEFGFYSACAAGRWVPLLADRLRGTGTKITSISGFPLGSAPSAAKAREAELAVGAGAHEVDMVLSVGDLVVGDDRRVEADIRAVRDAIPGAILKVILECGLLTDERKRAGARIAVAAGADFVKTCTGFGHGGATEADVRLLVLAVEGGAKVKASGGIRTREQAERLLTAGADRLGTSAGPAIVGQT